MEEIGSIHSLKSFAQKTGREINVIDTENQTEDSGSVPYPIKIVTIKDANDAWYIAYQDLKGDNMYSFFSGVFTTAPEPCPSRMSIVKKDFLDRLSFRTGYQSVKIGNPSFDKKTKIVSNNPPLVYRLMRDQRSQKLVEQALNLKPSLTVSINELVTEAAPELKNHSQLSIYLLKEWLVDEGEIEKLFTIVAELKKSCYPES